MPEQPPARDAKTNELRLSIEDVDVVSSGGAGAIAQPEGGTTIIVNLTMPPDY